MNLTINASSILLCSQPVDLRKSIDGLIDVIISALACGPKESIFIFCNRALTKLKILAWHHNRFVLLLKRLEKIFFLNVKQDVSINEKRIKQFMNILIKDIQSFF